jgi:hypothetical protein
VSRIDSALNGAGVSRGAFLVVGGSTRCACTLNTFDTMDYGYLNAIRPKPNKDTGGEFTKNPIPPSRLAYRLVDGEWQELWACRGEVQAGTPECSLRGTESGPTGGDRGSDGGLARAVKCRPSSFPMQAATPSVAVPALYHQSRA